MRDTAAGPGGNAAALQRWGAEAPPVAVLAPEELAAAVIQDTVRFLPVQPSHVSNVQGPYLQVKQVGPRAIRNKQPPKHQLEVRQDAGRVVQVEANAADIVLVGSFRAHFQPNHLTVEPDQRACGDEPEAEHEGAQPCGSGGHDGAARAGGPLIEEWTADAAANVMSTATPHVELADAMQDAEDPPRPAAGQLRRPPPPPQQQRYEQQQPLPVVASHRDAELQLVPAGGHSHEQLMQLGHEDVHALGRFMGAAGHAPDPLLASPRPRGDFELDPTKLTLGRRLAVGGFAEVFLGKYEGTAVAVKRLLGADKDATGRFVQEVSMLARLRHPNLLLFMGYTLLPEPCIVAEFMARGSLFSILRQLQGRPAEPRLQRTVAVAVARGMAYLHARTPPILHLDLKSPNILVDERWRIKIADFGLSTVRQHTFVSSGHVGGTPEWMAPEVLRSDQFAEPADVYSYGVVLWELLTGAVPWAELNAMQVVGAVGFARKSLPDPIEGDALLVHLCKVCRSADPAARPTFRAIVEVLGRHFGPPALAAGEQLHGAGEQAVAMPGPQAALAAPQQHGLLPATLHAGDDPMVVSQDAPSQEQRRQQPLEQQKALHRLRVAGRSATPEHAQRLPVPDVQLLSRHYSLTEPGLVGAQQLQDSPRARRRNRSPRGDDDDGRTASPVSSKLHKLHDGRKTPSPRTAVQWDASDEPARSRAAAGGRVSPPEHADAGFSFPAVAAGGAAAPLPTAATSPFAEVAIDAFPPPSAVLEPRPTITAAAEGLVAPAQQDRARQLGASGFQDRQGSMAPIQAAAFAAGQPLQLQQLQALQKHLGRLARRPGHRRVVSDDMHMQRLPQAMAADLGPSPDAEAGSGDGDSSASASQRLEGAQRSPSPRGLDRSSAPVTGSDRRQFPTRQVLTQGAAVFSALRAELLQQRQQLGLSNLITAETAGDCYSELSFAVDLQQDGISVGSGSVDRLGSHSLDNMLLVQVVENDGPIEAQQSSPPRTLRHMRVGPGALSPARRAPAEQPASPFAALATQQPFSFAALPGVAAPAPPHTHLPSGPSGCCGGSPAAAGGSPVRHSSANTSGHVSVGAQPQAEPHARAVSSYRSGRFKVTVEEPATTGEQAHNTEAAGRLPQMLTTNQQGAAPSGPEATAVAAAAPADPASRVSSALGDATPSASSGAVSEDLDNPSSPSAQHQHGDASGQRRHSGTMESPAAVPPLPAAGYKMYRKGRFFVSTHPAGASSMATTSSQQLLGPGPLQLPLDGSGLDSELDSTSDLGVTPSHTPGSGSRTPVGDGVTGKALYSSLPSRLPEEIRTLARSISSAGALPNALPPPPAAAAQNSLQASGRAYSKGRFEVVESIVAVPPSDLQRRSVSFSGADNAQAAAAAAAQATAQAVGSEPPEPRRTDNGFPHSIAAAAAAACYLQKGDSAASRGASGHAFGTGASGLLASAGRSGSVPDTADAAALGPRGEVMVKRVGRFTVRESADGAQLAAAQLAQQAAPRMRGSVSFSGFDAPLGSGTGLQHTNSGEARADAAGRFNGAGHDATTPSRDDDDVAQGLAIPTSSPKTTFTRVKSKGRFTVIEESHEPLLSSSPCVERPAAGTIIMPPRLTALGPRMVADAEQSNVRPLDAQHGQQAPGSSLASSADGSAAALHPAAPSLESQAQLHADTARMLQERIQRNSRQQLHGGGGAAHAAAANDAAAQAAGGFASCEVQVGNGGVTIEVHMTRGESGDGDGHQDAGVMEVDVAFGDHAYGDDADHHGGSDSGLGDDEGDALQPGTPTHDQNIVERIAAAWDDGEQEMDVMGGDQMEM